MERAVILANHVDSGVGACLGGREVGDRAEDAAINIVLPLNVAAGGIVDRHRELVGEQAIRPLQDEVADLGTDVLADAALDAVVEADRESDMPRAAVPDPSPATPSSARPER